MKPVYLVDASPYLFANWFKVPRTIVDADGKPVNAVYGFAYFMLKLLADHDPTHVAVAFDRHFNGSFRNEYYPDYKAHREASPPELDAQVDPCLDVVEALGITTFIDERYEADDLIATVIDQVRASYVIVTTDKDLTQLVTDRVSIMNKDQRFDAAGVHEKFGVRPDQITDYLALTGDAVDNIPGVRGIGPKTAAELLRRFGSLEGIYRNIDTLRRGPRADISVAAKLEADVSNAGLSKRLATVATDAPIKTTLDALRYRGADESRVRPLFERLGFKTLLERVTSRG